MRVKKKIIAKIINFLKRCKEETIISKKLPFKISVRSIPKTINKTPNGILKIKKNPKKRMNKKAK